MYQSSILYSRQRQATQIVRPLGEHGLYGPPGLYTVCPFTFKLPPPEKFRTLTTVTPIDSANLRLRKHAFTGCLTSSLLLPLFHANAGTGVGHLAASTERR
jgi:hypothetical protein